MTEKSPEERIAELEEKLETKERQIDTLIRAIGERPAAPVIVYPIAPYVAPAYPVWSQSLQITWNVPRPIGREGPCLFFDSSGRVSNQPPAGCAGGGVPMWHWAQSLVLGAPAHPSLAVPDNPAAMAQS